MGKGSSKLSPKDLNELSTSTEFADQEIRDWYKSFRKDCPSGILTLKEFEKLYKDIFPYGDASSFAKHAFRTFDSNGDGSLDFQEFMFALSITSRGSFEKRLRWAYSMYDMDHDGFISKNEMLIMIKAIYKMVGEKEIHRTMQDHLTPNERVEDIFKRMDKDRNCRITFDEFRTAVNRDPSLLMLMRASPQSS